MAFNKKEIAATLKDAKKFLEASDYGNFWYSVNRIAAMMGAADSPELDEELTAKINASLGGPV